MCVMETRETTQARTLFLRRNAPNVVIDFAVAEAAKHNLQVR